MKKFLLALWMFVAMVPAGAAVANTGLNVAGLAGIGIPLSGGNALFTYGAAVAYHSFSGVQLGAELDATMSGSTLAVQLDYYLAPEFFFGIQTGLGLSNGNPYFLGAQLGTEHELIRELLTLGPKIEYLFQPGAGSHTLEVLAALKLHL